MIQLFVKIKFTYLTALIITFFARHDPRLYHAGNKQAQVHGVSGTVVIRTN